jgi:hypothetical protein
VVPSGDVSVMSRSLANVCVIAVVTLTSQIVSMSPETSMVDV